MAVDAEQVRTILAEVLNLSIERVRLDADLRDDLGVKHLDLVDIALEIEGDLGIVVSWQRFCALRSVADVVGYIDERLAEMGETRVGRAA